MVHGDVHPQQNSELSGVDGGRKYPQVTADLEQPRRVFEIRGKHGQFAIAYVA